MEIQEFVEKYTKGVLNTISKTNIVLFNILNCPLALKYYKQVLSTFTRELRKKQYFIVVNNHFGYIMKNRNELLTVIDIANPLLKDFIIECRPEIRIVGNYRSIRMNFFDLTQMVTVQVSLGQILVFSKGEILENGYLAHHVQHPFVNFDDEVVKVTQQTNNSNPALIKTVAEAHEYNKRRLVGKDEKRFSTLKTNLQTLHDLFRKNRGICVDQIDLRDQLISLENTPQFQITKSLR